MRLCIFLLRGTFKFQSFLLSFLPPPLALRRDFTYILAGRYLVISYIFDGRFSSLLSIARIKREKERKSVVVSLFFLLFLSFLFISFLSCASYDSDIPSSSSFYSLISFASSFVATIYYDYYFRLIFGFFRLSCHSTARRSTCIPSSANQSPRYPCILAPSVPNELGCRVFFFSFFIFIFFLHQQLVMGWLAAAAALDWFNFSRKKKTKLSPHSPAASLCCEFLTV